MQTNAKISLYRVTKDWKGTETTAFVAKDDVWLEESTVEKWTEVQGKGTILVVGAGLIITEKHRDYTDCYFLIDGKRREIVAVNTFTDRQRNFHHSEIIYK